MISKLPREKKKCMKSMIWSFVAYTGWRVRNETFSSIKHGIQLWLASFQPSFRASKLASIKAPEHTHNTPLNKHESRGSSSVKSANELTMLRSIVTCPPGVQSLSFASTLQTQEEKTHASNNCGSSDLPANYRKCSAFLNLKA